MSWFRKLIPSRIRTEGRAKRNVPEGLWTKCPVCSALLYQAEVERNYDVCRSAPTTDASPRAAASITSGPGASGRDRRQSPARGHAPVRGSKRYREQIAEKQEQTGESDALVVIRGRVKGVELVAAAFEYEFCGGSMGSVVGERFVRAVDTAVVHRIPLLCFASSGGARMQEGLFALMQMAKTSAALTRLREHGLPYVSVLSDPTTGGVSASLGMLGDLNIAEPNALICFTGPRVIEQTIKEKLPEGFQRSEFLLEHGAMDIIMDRREMRDRIASLLAMLTRQPAPERRCEAMREGPLLGRGANPRRVARLGTKAASAGRGSGDEEVRGRRPPSRLGTPRLSHRHRRRHQWEGHLRGTARIIARCGGRTGPVLTFHRRSSALPKRFELEEER